MNKVVFLFALLSAEIYCQRVQNFQNGNDELSSDESDYDDAFLNQDRNVEMQQHQQTFRNIHVGKDFNNRVSNVKNDQRFEGVAVNGEFYNSVTGEKSNNQDFAADVNVRGKFYNDVSNRSRNNQNFDGLTVNNGSTEQTTEIHSNQYGNSDARSINRNRGRNNNQGRSNTFRVTQSFDDINVGGNFDSQVRKSCGRSIC